MQSKAKLNIFFWEYDKLTYLQRRASNDIHAVWIVIGL